MRRIVICMQAMLWLACAGDERTLGPGPNLVPSEVGSFSDGKFDDPIDPMVAPVAPILEGTLEVVGEAPDLFDGLRDLEFNPLAPEELWVISQRNNAVIIVDDIGSEEASASFHSGPGSAHFLAQPAALAFSTHGLFATAQETDEITQPSTPFDFMGPTMWTSDRRVFDGGHASHMDMLHNSPNGAGIAWWGGNAYFVFDGYHQSITYYDFRMDHGPGGADHSDGVVYRFAEGEVSYRPGVVSHLEVDRGSNRIFVADSGNSRVAVLDPSVGAVVGAISPNYDGTVQYRVGNADISTFVDGSPLGLTVPSGLALHDGVLYVGDNDDSEIFAFAPSGELIDSRSVAELVEPGGLMGMAFDQDGDLYFVDGVGDRILRLIATDD